MKTAEKEVEQDLRISNILRAITSVILSSIIIILSILFIVGSKAGINGYTARLVVSGSMIPSININDIVIIKICDIDDINEKDIICYKKDIDIVHRVVEKKRDSRNSRKGYLITQGDNNTHADDIEVTADMIIGKVIRIFNSHKVLNSKIQLDNKKALSLTVFIGISLLYIILSISRMFIMAIYLITSEILKSRQHRVRLNSISEINKIDGDNIVVRVRLRYQRLRAMREQEQRNK